MVGKVMRRIVERAARNVEPRDRTGRHRAKSFDPERSDCGLRIEDRRFKSAIRIPQSAIERLGK
jgi:hypothetical protein